MEIKYKNTLDDYLKYLNLYNNINSREKLIINIEKYSLLIGSTSIIIYNIIKYRLINKEFIIFLIGIILLNVLWIIYFPKIIKISDENYIKNLIKENADMTLEKVLKIDNDEILLSKKNSEKIINVKDISKVVEDNHNIYIFIKNYDIYAIIPLEYFNGIEEKTRFLSLLNI